MLNSVTKVASTRRCRPSHRRPFLVLHLPPRLQCRRLPLQSQSPPPVLQMRTHSVQAAYQANHQNP
jgi:hypothetical protein